MWIHYPHSPFCMFTGWMVERHLHWRCVTCVILRSWNTSTILSSRWSWQNHMYWKYHCTFSKGFPFSSVFSNSFWQDHDDLQKIFWKERPLFMAASKSPGFEPDWHSAADSLRAVKTWCDLGFHDSPVGISVHPSWAAAIQQRSLSCCHSAEMLIDLDFTGWKSGTFQAIFTSGRQRQYWSNLCNILGTLATTTRHHSGMYVAVNPLICHDMSYSSNVIQRRIATHPSSKVILILACKKEEPVFFFTLNDSDLHSLAAPKILLLWPPDVGWYSFTSHEKNKPYIDEGMYWSTKQVYNPVKFPLQFPEILQEFWESLQLLFQHQIAQQCWISPLIGRSHSCSKAAKLAAMQQRFERSWKIFKRHFQSFS